MVERGDRRLSKEDISFNCVRFLLRVLIHILVWFCDSFKFRLKFQAPIHEIDHLKKINSISCHLDTFIQSIGSQLRPLHNSIRIFLCFTEYCQLLKVGRCSLLYITLCTYTTGAANKQRPYTVMYKGCYSNSSTLLKPTNEGLLYATSFTITRTAVYNI